MSDCFDHMMDAYEDAMNRGYMCSGTRSNDKRPYKSRNFAPEFVPDPLYYHTRVEYSEIVAESDTSYLMHMGDFKVWVPKKICKQHDSANKTVYVHTNILQSIIKRILGE
jgi:hypothetical protein